MPAGRFGAGLVDFSGSEGLAGVLGALCTFSPGLADGLREELVLDGRTVPSAELVRIGFVALTERRLLAS